MKCYILSTKQKFCKKNTLREGRTLPEAYCAYLRKSRKDDDLEGTSGALELTLKRHEAILTALAKKMNLTITKIFREVVSGDSISERPEMQKLLAEVGNGLWAGVLVVEIERLARGDTSDQGLVAETFRYSHTKIITPIKVYDPDDEYDEEYFEFGLFMSRREYKVIKRRMTRGRKAAVAEGKWIYGKAPYGYRVVKLKGEKGNTLEPDENANNAKLIFDLYASGLGGASVSRYLNNLGIVNSQGNPWSPASILEIVQNPVYLGKVKYGSRPLVVRMENGVKKVSEPRVTDYLLADGRHPALVTQELFDKCRENRINNRRFAPNANSEIANPLCGLLVCSECGRRLIRTYDVKQKRAFIYCNTQTCKTPGSILSLVEESLLDILRSYVSEAGSAIPSAGPVKIKQEAEILRKKISAVENNLQKLKKQKDKLFDLLEQGVYTVEIFLERQKTVSDSIDETQKSLDKLTEDLEEKLVSLNSFENLIPKIKSTVETYDSLKSAEAKNLALKSVIDHVVYHKSKAGTKYKPAPFELEVYFKS